MFIDKDSIIINNVSMGQYITKAEYGFNKLWASDSGRTLSGETVGSLIGIFPKLVLHFRKLTQQELEIIAPILDSANQNVSYYDPYKKNKITITTYTGDYTITSNSIGGKTDAFSISFISTKKRG